MKPLCRLLHPCLKVFEGFLPCIDLRLDAVGVARQEGQHRIGPLFSEDANSLAIDAAGLFLAERAFDFLEK